LPRLTKLGAAHPRATDRMVMAANAAEGQDRWDGGHCAGSWKGAHRGGLATWTHNQKAHQSSTAIEGKSKAHVLMCQDKQALTPDGTHEHREARALHCHDGS